LRHLEERPVLGQHVAGRLRQDLVERSEHQRERRAELVAHVAEESGLRAVKLGERLGARALLLVGLRIRDAGGDLPGHEVEEAAVVAVELAERVHAHRQHAGAAALAGGGDRDQRDLGGCPMPGAGGKLGRRRVCRNDARLRVCARDRKLQRRRLRRADARGAHERTIDVNDGERQVPQVRHERFSAQGAGLLPGACVGRARGELTQRGELALADHAACIVGVGANEPRGATVVARHRAVGERVVGLLLVAVALHDQELRLDVRAFVARHDRVGHRADLMPDLGPHLAERLA